MCWLTFTIASLLESNFTLTFHLNRAECRYAFGLLSSLREGRPGFPGGSKRVLPFSRVTVFPSHKRRGGSRKRAFDVRARASPKAKGSPSARRGGRGAEPRSAGGRLDPHRCRPAGLQPRRSRRRRRLVRGGFPSGWRMALPRAGLRSPPPGPRTRPRGRRRPRTGRASGRSRRPSAAAEATALGSPSSA